MKTFTHCTGVLTLTVALTLLSTHAGLCAVHLGLGPHHPSLSAAYFPNAIDWFLRFFHH